MLRHFFARKGFCALALHNIFGIMRLMRQELLDLAGQVMARKSWAQSTLESAFGSPGIVDRLKKTRDPSSGGKRRGPTIDACEDFKIWLQEQLEGDGHA